MTTSEFSHTAANRIDTPIFQANLATTPEGFSFETRHSIGRTAALAPEQRLQLTSDQGSRLASAVQGEMKFQGAQIVRDARSAWRQTPNSPDLKAAFLDARATYLNKGKKLGLRHVKLSGTHISADVQLVPFPVYNEFSSYLSSPELQELSRVGATSMILRTADDKIVIQHRAVEKQKLHETGKTRGNSTYPDVPGASAAGLLDASLLSEDRAPGTPDKVDTAGLRERMDKEVREELGLDSEDLQDVRIVGFAQDKIKLTEEVLFLANSDLTADEIKAKSQESLPERSKTLSAADFEEKFIIIDGSAESIHTLLTQAHCPIPPTHTAGLVAAGFISVLEQQGQQVAEEWLSSIELGITENYEQHIDRLVQEHFTQYPEAFYEIPERFWNKNVPERDTSHYTPTYTPDEQGLPSFDDELVRLGLMPEQRTVASRVNLFSIDHHTNTQEIHTMLDQIVHQLKEGEPVGITSHHSSEWTVENIIKPLKMKNADLDLNLLGVVGENGATWATIDNDNVVHHGQSPAVTIPETLNNALVETLRKYSDQADINDPKHTMISVTMKDSSDTVARERLTHEFQTQIQNLNLGEKFIITEGVDGIEIKSIYVGEALAVRRFLDIMKEKGIAYSHAAFELFGDDSSMANVNRALKQHSINR